MSIKSERMRRLKDVPQAPKAKLAPAKEATYTRTWDDDHKPVMTEGIAYASAAQLALKMQMSLEDAKAQIWEDFTVVKRKIRVRPGVAAHAEHLAKNDHARQGFE